MEFKIKNFGENKKNLEKLCKKTRSNSKNIVEENFSNIDHFVG
jgi:hypothetical protein